MLKWKKWWNCGRRLAGGSDLSGVGAGEGGRTAWIPFETLKGL